MSNRIGVHLIAAATALLALTLPSRTLFGMGPGEMSVLASEESRGVTELIVRSDSYDVNLLGTEGATTTVEIFGDRGVEPRIRERGGRLVVEAQERRALFSRGGGRGRIDIRTGQAVQVEARTGSGDVDIRRFQDGTVKVDVASGNVEGRALYGVLTLRSASGDIVLERIGGEVEVRSSSGEIELRTGEGELNVSSTSGTVSLEQVTGDISAESTSGGVEVQAGSGTFFLSSTSGDVEGDALEITGGSTFGSISGNIDLDIDGDPEAFDLNLKSTSGSIRLPGAEIGNQYIRDGGGLSLEARTVSGNIRIR